MTTNDETSPSAGEKPRVPADWTVDTHAMVRGKCASSNQAACVCTCEGKFHGTKRLAALIGEAIQHLVTA